MSVQRLISLTVAVVVGIGIGMATSDFGRRMFDSEEPPAATVLRYPNIGGPFTLTDHTGKRVTEKDYAGKILLVFFGFTHCPDVCPTALTAVSEVLDQIDDKAREVQPLFITVDPERDTVELLAGYVSHFHPSIVGLTGTAEEIGAAAQGYQVFYRKAKGGTPDAYSMEHTASIYVMDRQGKFRGTLDVHETADTRIKKLQRLIEEPARPIG